MMVFIFSSALSKTRINIILYGSQALTLVLLVTLSHFSINLSDSAQINPKILFIFHIHVKAL